MRSFRPLIAALLLAVPAWAQDETVESTIRSQIDAFLQDDFPTAFGFASPGIRAMFGTPERFGQMVTQGYPMVHRPADLRLLDSRSEDGRLLQRVEITDGQGRLHLLDYEMLETPDGWRIDGVFLLRSDALGA
jgi:hypothetical protein